MSYSVSYSGSLNFVNELTDAQYHRLKSLYGNAERRAKKEAIHIPTLFKKYQLQYPDVLKDSIDSLITTTIKDDETGIEAYDEYLIPIEELNLIILFMREEFPEFGLTGEMQAQGEEIGDVFRLYVGRDGFVHIEDMDPLTKKSCNGKYTLSDGIDYSSTIVGVCENRNVKMVGEDVIDIKYCPFCGQSINLS